MSDIPYFPFYPDTFLADTAMLTNEEKGVYFVLLCYLWINGAKLPDDDKKLSRLLGIPPQKCRKIRKNLAGFFEEIEDGFFTQKRLRKEWEKAQEIRKKYAENGKKGGRPKKGEGAENQDNEASSDLFSAAENESDGFSETKAMGFDSLKPLDKRNHKPNETIPEPKPAPAPNPKILPKASSLSTRGAVEKWQGRSPCGSTLERLTADICALFISLNIPLPDEGHLLQQWLEVGADPERDIKPTIRKVLERNLRRGVSPPRSFSYFIEPINEAFLKRLNKR